MSLYTQTFFERGQRIKYPEIFILEFFKGFNSPFKDLYGSIIDIKKYFHKDLAVGFVEKRTIRTVAGLTGMLWSTAKIAEELYNKIINSSDPCTKNRPYLVIPLATTLFALSWGLVIGEKSAARGIKNYKEKIAKISLNPKIEKEGTALIFNPVSDHNGAFNGLHSVINYGELSERFRIISPTVATSDEELEKIHSYADQGHDIKVYMGCGHGSGLGSQRGESDDKESEKQPFHFDKHFIYGYERGWEAALNRLNPQAVIVLYSCSTAEEPKLGLSPSATVQTKNLAHRIAALANKRLVVAARGPAHCQIENDENSPHQGLKFTMPRYATGENMVLHIQENEQNTKEFEKIRRGIELVREYTEIESNIMKLKKEQGYSLPDPIHLRVHVPENRKGYFQYSLEGPHGNRLGVESIEYIPIAEKEPIQISIISDQSPPSYQKDATAPTTNVHMDST